ncbi:hypothetical protein [uncultured Mediterranea sp.]|uniref:hypothetical protein n=1 Tax=uncultured Mediterranea sp. TaxID=1926662 RepID=UPI0027D94809|nr:hypothetical protein [uncultured Mediterranea sp.]
MNQTNNYYRVGPHVLRIGCVKPLETSALLPSFAPFALPVEEGEEAAEVIEVDICPSEVAAVTDVEDTFPQPVSFEWENVRCSLRRRADGNYRIGIAPLDNLAVEAYTDCTDRFRRNVISLPEALRPIAPFVVNNFLMMIYTFATAERGTLMVHASVIRYEGHGYLFLGKSGTGKSTHTHLWLKYIEGSRLLNDDNPVVAFDPKTGEATVYGTPWSGKTPCYLNESVPVGAFVRLEQAPANAISRLTATHAFAALLPSCSCLKQDAAIYKGIIDTVTRIATRIPVCHLRCLPDEAAARLSMQTVTQAGGGQPS